jgi:hypothetical protein
VAKPSFSTTPRHSLRFAGPSPRAPTTEALNHKLIFSAGPGATYAVNLEFGSPQKER